MNNTTSTTQTNQAFRRTSRHPSAYTRQKISSSLKGRVVSDETRQRLSDSLRAYWSNPDNFPADTEGNGGWLTDILEDNNGD